MQLFFVRHGRPEIVENCDGPADPPLNDDGHAQARGVGEWLMTQNIDVAYSSPMRRATDTAAPFIAASGIELALRDGLREFDYGSTSYVPSEVRKARDPEEFRQWVAKWLDGGLGLVQFRTDVVAEVDRIAKDHPGQRVAVFCHAGVINALLAECLCLPEESYMRFHPDYTSVSRVKVSRDLHRKIASINERPHFVANPEFALNDT